jgi:phage replication O-like protein O
MTVTSGADIQTENGFVQLHPAILELLAQRQLSGREFRCLLFLFRKTYGYHKKTDKISLSQWEQGTGIPRTRVGAVLDSLVAQNLILKVDNGTKRPATWGFNKHFETWQGEESVTLEGDSLEQEESQSVTPTGDTSVTLEGDRLKVSVTLEGDKTVTLQGDNNIYKDSRTAGGPSDYFGMKRPMRRERVVADGYTQDAAKEGVDAETFRGSVDKLVDAAGWRRLVDVAGDDSKLSFAKQDALKLVRLGTKTIAQTTALVEAYKATPYKKEHPLPRDISEYASQIGERIPVAVTPSTANGKVSGFSLSEMLGGS